MKNVIVWGTGKYFNYKVPYLEKRGYQIIGVVSKDTDSLKESKYDCISKQEIASMNYDQIIIMSERFMFEILQEMLELEIPLEKIEFGVNLAPATDSEAAYISDEIKLRLQQSGKVVWNGKIEVSSMSDIEAVKSSHRGFMSNDTMAKMPMKPLSYNYGKAGTGHSIARFFIDQFAKECSEDIQGIVMEVGDDRYTKFGQETALEKSLILVLESMEGDRYVKGNLETGEGLKDNMIDCFILTNVFSSLYDLRAAATNVGRTLKPGGKAIITVPGIASLYRPQYETYGQFWRFTQSSITRLLEECIPGAKLTLKTYGNVKTSAAFLYGMTVEDLTPEELEYRDSNFPMVIGILLEK